MEVADEVEGEVVGEARGIEELGEDEGEQDGDGADDGALGQREDSRGRCAAEAVEMGDLCLVPAADPGQNDHAEKGSDGEPGRPHLANRQNDKRDEKGADG